MEKTIATIRASLAEWCKSTDRHNVCHLMRETVLDGFSIDEQKAILQTFRGDYTITVNGGIIRFFPFHRRK